MLVYRDNDQRPHRPPDTMGSAGARRRAGRAKRCRNTNERSHRNTLCNHAADSWPAQAGVIDARGNAPHRNDDHSGSEFASTQVLEVLGRVRGKNTLLALLEWRFSF